jgi:hypothetical protein
VLRGIFTLRRVELEWFYQAGAHMLFADYFEPFRAAIPEEERGNMMKAYYKRLTGDNEEEKLKWYISNPLFSFRRSTNTLQCQRVESLGNSHIQTDGRSRARRSFRHEN